MPGPYRRLDVPNVNQHVVTTPPKKAKKAAAEDAVKADEVADDAKPAETKPVKKSAAK